MIICACIDERIVSPEFHEFENMTITKPKYKTLLAIHVVLMVIVLLWFLG